MTLIARLTIPTLIGGFVALAATGLFSPQVNASWAPVDVIAQVSGVEEYRVLNVRTAPDADATLSGTLSRNAFVWVESCDGVMGQEGWCLVERGGVKGWTDARYLTLRDN